MRGRTRCHLHGGLSFGPPPGSQNNLSTGNYTAEAVAARRQAKRAAKAAKLEAEAGEGRARDREG
jgi:hypothetical protein